MKIIRTATLGTSLSTFCEGILKDLKDGVIGMPVEVIALASPDKELNDIGYREGVRTIGVPMERRISLMKDLKSLYTLIQVFRQEKPDMVHSMTPKAGLLCMVAGWLTRVPVRVHTFTGLVWPTSKGLQRRILMATDWVTCACATHVIPEGQGVMADLAEHITGKPMRVLGFGNVMGIDLESWKRARVSGFKFQVPGVFTFLFVGRIVGDKGINELIEAMSSLINDKSQILNHKVRLVLVGRYEEELDPVLPETRRKIEAMPEIEAVGPQYGEDLLEWYAAADCFVFPSYREGFPNTVIEAGAMEVPCIVTDINGSREIITASVDVRHDANDKCQKTKDKCQMSNDKMRVCPNGVVIPSKDTEALYEAMLWMLEHQEERKAMGKRARQMVADRYEQGFVRRCLYDFYKEVLGE